uniref:RagB/SusD family nutrient uptake outer membrane protein n=1 Tax=uncultured Draconibacterium sp. TaxID=1573823 RepID=UPI0032166860
MNKKLIYYFTLIAVVLFSSCNDEFLDRYDHTAINEDSYWNSASDLELYNNNLYASYFTSAKGFGGGASWGILMEDNYSDNSMVRSPNTLRLGTHTYTDPVKSNWNWTLIRNVNIFLENYQKANEDEETLNHYAAEARLLRALDYYDKVKLYGDLPLVDRVFSETDEAIYEAQSPRDEIVDFIMADLDYAVQWMNESSVRNRFNKTIAQSYKARICLHEGTFRKYHGLGGESSFLQAAAEAAEAVINSGNYIIDATTSYGSLFQNLDLAGNKEVIMYKDYDVDLGIKNNIRMNALNSDNVNGASASGTKSLIEDYLCNDGLPITESPLYQGDGSMADVFANRDERLKGTFGKQNDLFLDSILYLSAHEDASNNSSSPSGYQLVKFFNEENDYTPWGGGFIDAPIFRYAEVLLIYAEAKVETGGITQPELDKSINLLRAKAKVAPMTAAKANIDEIRRERRVELAFEGFRYDDLMRWKQGSKLAEPVLGAKFNSSDFPGTYTEGVNNFHLNTDGYIMSNEIYVFDESKHYYFPVPFNELSLNPNLKQTLGWPRGE